MPIDMPMEGKQGTVYIAQNNINNKMYIGQTIQDFRKRLACHKYYKGGAIGNAIRKYGLNNFTILQNQIPEELLDNLESNLIWFYDTIKKSNGYNLTSGGNKHKHVSDSSRLKMSLAKMGKPSPFRGKSHTQESKHSMSVFRLGKRSTLETRKKQSESLKLTLMSTDIRKRMSLSHLGKRHTMETRNKISKSNSGKPVSQETRKKISESLRNRYKEEAMLVAP